MDLTDYIDTFQVLNIDISESTLSIADLYKNADKPDNESYIISDADEEMIILIGFKKSIDMKSIILFGIENPELEDASLPKQIHIYNVKNLNYNFDDIKSLSPHKSFKCSTKKLSSAAGQKINLSKKLKNPIAFKKTLYLAIYIESNQNDDENTYLNAISFKGEYSDDKQHDNLNKPISNMPKVASINLHPGINDIDIDPQKSNKKEPQFWKCSSCKFDRNSWHNPICKSCEEIDKPEKFTKTSTTTNTNHPMYISKMPKSSNTTMDMSIFLNQQPLKNNDHSYQDCIAISRLLVSLKYYSDLNPHENHENRAIFENFTNEVYKNQIIDDYCHLQKYHNKEIQEILKQLQSNGQSIECDIKSCNFTSRHHRINDKEAINDTSDPSDPYYGVYCDIMDSLHYYINHLFDAGLRCHSIEGIHDDDKKQDDDDDDTEEINFDLYDETFAKILKETSSTKTASNKFPRLSMNKKFNIKIHNEYQEKHITYLDQFFNHLYSNKAHHYQIQKLKEWMVDNGYDSESMNMDLKIDDAKGGNIRRYINDDAKFATIMSIINAAQGLYYINSILYM